jgi:hypothetical protein
MIIDPNDFNFIFIYINNLMSFIYNYYDFGLIYGTILEL